MSGYRKTRAAWRWLSGIPAKLRAWRDYEGEMTAARHSCRALYNCTDRCTCRGAVAMRRRFVRRVLRGTPA